MLMDTTWTRLRSLLSNSNLRRRRLFSVERSQIRGLDVAMKQACSNNVDWMNQAPEHQRLLTNRVRSIVASTSLLTATSRNLLDPSLFTAIMLIYMSQTPHPSFIGFHGREARSVRPCLGTQDQGKPAVEEVLHLPLHPITMMHTTPMRRPLALASALIPALGPCKPRGRICLQVRAQLGVGMEVARDQEPPLLQRPPS